MSAVDTADPDATPARARPPLLAVDARPRASTRSAPPAPSTQLLLVEWPLPWPARRERDPGAGGGGRRPARPADDGRPASRRRGGRRARRASSTTGGRARTGSPASTTACRSPTCPRSSPRCSSTRSATSTTGRPSSATRRRRSSCAATAVATRAAVAGARCCTSSWRLAPTDVRVWRCSHTGGHRFAPTAITLPDGRAWAYADADLIDGVIDRTADVAGLGAARPRLPGPRSVGPGGRAGPVRASSVGRGSTATVTATRTEVADDRQSARVRLEWRAGDGSGGHADAEVVVTRTLPVLGLRRTARERPRSRARSSRLRRLDVTP